jgi:hypothetical protein
MSRYPNFLQSIGLLLLIVLLQVILAIPLGLLGMATQSNLTNNPLMIAVVNLLSIGLVLLFGLKHTKSSFQEVFRLAPIRLSLLLPMALTVIGMTILLSEFDNRLRTVLPIPNWLSEILKNLFGSRENLLASFFTLVIVAPLTEELLFRGLILRGFLSNYSVRKAILTSSLLFGIFHLNPWQFTGAFVLGAIFAWWFVKTDSLLPCLFGHALNNGLPVILLVLPQLQISGYSTELTDQVVFQPLWFNLLGLALAGLGFWLLARQFAELDLIRSNELTTATQNFPSSDDRQSETLI